MQTDPKIIVQKATGEEQFFSPHKLREFLKHIRVGDHDIERIVGTVWQQSHQRISTKEIALHVTQLLQQLKGGATLAARYNLKDALRRMGPEGHNFENYVGRLFAAEHYNVDVSIIMQGKCVSHEVDVFAVKGHERNIIECKFHNREGIRSEITTAMYTHARVMDLNNAFKNQDHAGVGWLATNTKLTLEALKYVNCVGMKLLSVENPVGDSIMDRVVRAGLFPVSSLEILEPYINEFYLQNIVLLSDILTIDDQKAGQLGLPTAILNEAQMQAAQILQLTYEVAEVEETR